MSRASFKAEVLRRCGGRCQVVGCDADAVTVHHLYKTSVYPGLAENPRVGVGMCGPDHAEIERRLRCGESTYEMLPGRVWKDAEKAVAEYVAGQIGGD